MRTFAWRPAAAATVAQYRALRDQHPVLADVACFRSAHVNHLTPRTLDIAAAQERMRDEAAAGAARGPRGRHQLRVKDRIEGPPARRCPILLRQTSFLAVEEAIEFRASGAAAADGVVDGAECPAPPPPAAVVGGSHRARFGEIEERGAAVTPRGRMLYDELLGEAMAAAQAVGGGDGEMDRLVGEVFGERYPDDWDELRTQGLIYCSYRCTAGGLSGELELDDDVVSYSLETLVRDGILEAQPITYEDFLPLSAAGIFQSNLGSKSPSAAVDQASPPDVEGMEEALGTKLHDADELYRRMQDESIEACASSLGIRIEY